VLAVFPSTATVASSPRLLDRVRWHLRGKHYSIRTEQSYVDWIRRFILFHRKRHPKEMGEKEISEFLSHLAVEKNVAASTQNQAFSALLFLYQQVLDRKLQFIGDVQRVTRPAKLPVVFTPAEVRAVLAQLKGDYRLMAELLYGAGLRLMECVRLRVKDIDFGYGHITVRDGKGLRDRVTVLPEKLRHPFSYIWNGYNKFISKIWREKEAEFICPSLWSANIETRIVPGHGNTFSRLPSFPRTRAQARYAVITSPRTIYKRR
jgi:integrase